MQKKVVSIDRDTRHARRSKSRTPGSARRVEATEKAIHELPLASGTWRVEGVPGLYVRCHLTVKSFFVQRKVRGVVVKVGLGQVSLSEARDRAMEKWAKIKPKPAPEDIVTLEQAFAEYMERKQLAESTRKNYTYNFDRYLGAWKSRSLYAIGHDRRGVRELERDIIAAHGKATWNQVMRLLAAVYRYRRRMDLELPESPTIATDIHRLTPRDWAMSPEELRLWWENTRVDRKGVALPGGVKHLGPIKRAWWLTALFTGARKRSIESLERADVDLEKKTILYRVTKSARPYAVPIADVFARLLAGYMESVSILESPWLFPSTRKAGSHITNVRDANYGISSPHHTRHTFRTTLTEVGATEDQTHILMGHSMGKNVSLSYITAAHVIDSMRPVVNAVAERYVEILGDLDVEW